MPGPRPGSPTSSSCGSRPALDTLRALPDEETIDLAFIDADKGGYAAYYAELLARLRPGGVILVDNTLWSGRVLDDDADDDNSVAIRAFNDLVAADDRVDSYILPVGDGLTLVRKTLTQPAAPLCRVKSGDRCRVRGV